MIKKDFKLNSYTSENGFISKSKISLYVYSDCRYIAIYNKDNNCSVLSLENVNELFNICNSFKFSKAIIEYETIIDDGSYFTTAYINNEFISFDEKSFFKIDDFKLLSPILKIFIKNYQILSKISYSYETLKVS